MQKAAVRYLLILTLGLLLAAAPALAQPPVNPELAARINAGYDLLEKGKYDEAGKIYAEILKQQPDNALVLNNLAAIACKQGNYDQALAQLKQALPLSKGYKVTLNRVCSVQGVCAAYRISTDKFGQDNLEDLIKSNILMVQMAAAEHGPAK